MEMFCHTLNGKDIYMLVTKERISSLGLVVVHYSLAGCLNEANQPYEIIKTVCPLADDIWLNAYIRYNGFDVVCVHRNAGVPEWHIEHNQKLCYVNGELKRNDVQLFDVIRYFEEKYSSNPFSL